LKPSQEIPQSQNILDKWMLARLQSSINVMTSKLDTYSIMEATNELAPLITDLSTWYIRRSRDRIKNGDLASLQTLYYTLSQITKLAAPMMPFLSEKMYEVLNLRELTGLESVHLDLYPEARELTKEDAELLETMANTRKIVSAALSLRVENGLKVRQPLNRLFIELEDIPYSNELIIEEVNIKQVLKGRPDEKSISNFVFSEPVWLEKTISEELKLEGVAREMIRSIQDLRKEYNLSITDRVNVTYMDKPENIKAVEKFAAEIKQKTLADSLKPGVKYEVIKT
ncbi:MAG TPA: class I tRNA ligase family protein, partial [Candidatus Saccharimonadales bacterium]|nr:class I tRNA ligase family protein [Candidatus Saccharimonadales bacterium]